MNNAKLIARLARVKETPIAPAWLLDALAGRDVTKVPHETVASRQMDEMKAEAARVPAVTRRIQEVPSTRAPEQTLL